MTREEAIEVYHVLLNQKIKEAFEVFAPELKESEDEIHREWILEYLYDGLRKSDEQFKGQFKSAINWLEKQKDQPEVDLEKEFKTWWKSISGKINVEHIMEWYMHETAHHFYELGLKAKEK